MIYLDIDLVILFFLVYAVHFIEEVVGLQENLGVFYFVVQHDFHNEAFAVLNGGPVYMGVVMSKVLDQG